MDASFSSSGWRWVALCGGFAATLAAGALAWTRPPAAPAAAARGTAPRQATIGMDTPLGATEVTVAIDQLIRDYLADERAADERYRFRTVAVTGVLLEVDRRDPQVTALVVTRQIGSKESPCACQGGRALEQAAAGLSPGQPITVRGKLAGQERMRVVLLGCEVVPSPITERSHP